MVAAEIASVTAKPSMILPRNRRVGNLIDSDRFSPGIPTPVFVLKTTRVRRAPPPDSGSKTIGQWIKVRKYAEEEIGPPKTAVVRKSGSARAVGELTSLPTLRELRPAPHHRMVNQGNSCLGLRCIQRYISQCPAPRGPR